MIRIGFRLGFILECVGGGMGGRDILKVLTMIDKMCVRGVENYKDFTELISYSQS